ncbi:hypothetical protein SISSUDRAFT_1054717 [Sistotremastrum suecicum HHB10207 ss-3]|uniref:Uncharacterized protein n=1 Tax=Sistotremastrum suecicum HHB10207 ss-3 TaxID=1314776 RepID=A0A165Y9X3_9AGAM|nr:hypothetical protein SISSUDRAFT_1054717 [Sistotremastrum suecicum HHB10207 ss-3]
MCLLESDGLESEIGDRERDLSRGKVPHSQAWLLRGPDLPPTKVGQGGMNVVADGFWPGLFFIPWSGRAHTRPLGSGQVKEWG